MEHDWGKTEAQKQLEAIKQSVKNEPEPERLEEASTKIERPHPQMTTQTIPP